MRADLASPTPEDTRAIGAAIATLLRPGDAVALTGELGAGKTTLVHGLAAALGYEGAVASPTFTLVREYRAPRLTILHADVYRLDRLQDVLDLGLAELLEAEMLEGGGVLLVEWGDAVESLLPADHLVVELTVPGEGDARAVTIRPVGSGWAGRWERLEQAVDAWRVP
jgi:tRNA threonylcarbamoyladenosine biosynthesis protein TsaE